MIPPYGTAASYIVWHPQLTDEAAYAILGWARELWLDSVGGSEKKWMGLTHEEMVLFMNGPQNIKAIQKSIRKREKK